MSDDLRTTSDERMSAAPRLRDELRSTLTRWQLEHGLSTEEIIGTLEVLKQTIMDDCFRILGEDDCDG